MTLLEVAVALAVLALAAGIVVPSLVLPRRAAPDLSRVIMAARAMAIARAQTLELNVDATTGQWQVSELAPDVSSLQWGTLPAVPSAPTRVRFTALGSCLVQEPAPDELRAWDAARCRVSQAAARP